MQRKRARAIPEDVDRLRHIDEFCARLGRHVAGRTPLDFSSSEALQDQVIRCLTVIGEAAANLSDPARERVPGVEWGRIVALRHLLVHSYDHVQYPRAWITATVSVPTLHVQVRAALAEWPTTWGARDNSHVHVLLTAAGVGSRLRPITDTLAKCLVPIAGRPLLDYWFDAFQRAGIRKVLINTHHLPEQVRAYIEAKNATGLFHVQETYEPTLLGSAGTITANKDFVPINSEALIIYSDNLSDLNLSTFLDYHRSHADPFTMLLFRAQFPEKSGIVELAQVGQASRLPATNTPLPAAGKVLSFIEKPQHPKSNLANAGVYAMTGECWHDIASWNAFDIGFDVLPRLVGRMHAVEIAGGIGSYHRDIGTHESLAIANNDAPRVFPHAR